MHLIVLQHGLWGQTANTRFLANLLDSCCSGVPHYVYNSDVNNKLLTYDGVDVCGQRLTDTILELCKKYKEDGTPFTKFSVIGYSMGGLITRYAVGKLYAEGFFKEIEPVNFVTIATPHLGSWKMPVNIVNKAFNSLVPVCTSRSGYQLMLEDKHTWGRPILCLMSHPQLPFFLGLQLFRKRILLANIEHDRPVPYCTAAIRLDNPYVGRGPVPIDPEYPSIVRPLPEEDEGSQQRRIVKGSWIRVFVVAFAPFIIPLMLYMTFTGKRHHNMSRKREFDYNWIKVAYADSLLKTAPDSGSKSSPEGERGPLPGPGSPNGPESNRSGNGNGVAEGLTGPETPDGQTSGPDAVAPSLTQRSVAVSAFSVHAHAEAGGEEEQTDVQSPSFAPSPSSSSSAAAAAAAVTAYALHDTDPSAAFLAAPPSEADDDDADDGDACLGASTAVASALSRDHSQAVSEKDVFLTEGIVEAPLEVYHLQEWIVENLNRLEWEKVDVDCKNYHAHAAIIIRTPARFPENRDILTYLMKTMILE